MEAPEPFDEEIVRALLDGTPDEVAEGLEVIDRHFRKSLSSYVKARSPGLESAQLADVWQETLIDLYDMIQEKRFEAEKPLLPLLCTIATRRAADRFRKVKNEKRALKTVGARAIEAMPERALEATGEGALDAVGRKLAGTAVGRFWRRLEPVERAEFSRELATAIARLPAQQRAVMQAFVDGYPETVSDAVLKEATSELTGQPETLPSVKRAKQEARKKVREFLERKGYGRGERDVA